MSREYKKEFQKGKEHSEVMQTFTLMFLVFVFLGLLHFADAGTLTLEEMLAEMIKFDKKYPPSTNSNE
ncbi:unnamed protein product [Caenorhabditis auriculariae]|uniref:Uncharacterized protein n=1 Tax=Caenorhabditis auriculariae TaxID=2777116 RepID=A0A8S1HQE9_9PELO|nr:unnamed protein product [Caenorhabditis auriculariae]